MPFLLSLLRRSRGRRQPLRTRTATALLAAIAAAVPGRAATAQGAAQGPAQGTRFLTLADALDTADRAAYANRGAVAAADAAQAAASESWRGVLPALAADASVVRTNDPIGAFGFLLKQRSVSSARFAPDALNHPDAVTNYGAGLVLEQPLVNVDAWMGLRAARATSEATAIAARWTAMSVRVEVVQAYYGAVVAAEQADAMAAAERAAREHVRAAEAAAENGFVTRSDVLLARVRAGDVSAQRIEADSRARTARAALAVLLGAPGDTAFTLPTMLPAPSTVMSRMRVLAAADDRADVRAAREAANAARFALRRAEGTFLPRVNGFVRYDWNAAGRIGAASPAVTVGAAASWSLFGGGREVADARAAAARLRKAESDAEGAAASAQLDRRNADEAFTVALARAAIADTAVQQSAEALRIVRRKYDGGIAAITELLSAAAADMQARVTQSHSRYRVIAAAAARLRAWGADPAVLTAFDPDLPRRERP